MKRHGIHIILVILVLTFTSCATMFNSKQVDLKIITNEPTNLIVNADSLKYLGTEKNITVNRDRNLAHRHIIKL